MEEQNSDNKKGDYNAQSTVEEFVQKQTELIELEKQEEVEKIERLLDSLPRTELEKRGLAVLNQEITETATGLYGRVLVTLEPKNRAAQSQQSDTNKATKFSAGDIVGLRAVVTDLGPEGLPSIERGVVSRVAKNRIQIALNQPPNETLSPTWDVVQLTNQVTFKRMSRVLETLARYNGPALGTVQVLLGQRAPNVKSLPASAVPGLNPPQCEAIAFALGEGPLTLIEGPPGTGKTTTVAALIGQAVRAGMRVLATAPSNVAVDNLIEKLVALPGPKISLVRLGHPARLLASAVDYSLDAVYQESNVREVCEDVRQEMEQVREEIKSSRGSARKNKWEQWRGLQRELKQRQVSGLTALVHSCQVVLATCTGAADKLLARVPDFDLVVIDEAGQALKPLSLIPMLRGKKTVLVGDHNQLPPTVMSKQAESQGLSETFFAELIKRHAEQISRMLVIQYRMHEKIMTWSSNEFYQRRLVADPSVAHRVLADLPLIKSNENTTVPLLFIDTNGCGLWELEGPDGDSKANEGEVDVVWEWVQRLIASGLGPEQISVISPYLHHVNLLRAKLAPKYPSMEINTVDSFQGREKEAVVLSMVRCNRNKEVGFLKDYRRLNVAVTRARRQCTLIGDSETLNSDPLLQRLVAYFSAQGEHWSAHEFLPDVRFYSAPPPKKNNANNNKKKKKNKPKNKTAAKPQSENTSRANSNNTATNSSAGNNVNTAPKNSNTNRDMSSPVAEQHPVTQSANVNVTRVNPTPPQEVTADAVSSEEEHEEVKSSNAADTAAVGQVPQPSNTAAKKKKKKKKPANKPTNQASAPKKDKLTNEKEAFENMTDDEVLDQAFKFKNVCHYPQCDKSVAIVGSVCDYCHYKYCYTHFHYETHGCGEAARESARKDWLNQQRTTGTKPKEWQANYVRNKLQKKLEEQKAARTKQPKAKK